MKIKRIISSLCAVAIALTATCATASADGEYSYGYKTASGMGHSTFNKAWKDYGTVTINKKTYEFTFGFDTWCSNEDYIDAVYSQTKGYTYYGKIVNYTGESDITNKKSDNKKTNKADIQHTGKYVRYYVYSRTN